jgi:hypothetical protein
MPIKPGGSFGTIRLEAVPQRCGAGGTGTVAPGRAVALRPGLVLSFGDGLRLIRVVE